LDVIGCLSGQVFHPASFGFGFWSAHISWGQFRFYGGEVERFPANKKAPANLSPGLQFSARDGILELGAEDEIGGFLCLGGGV
jgi:hypothetical protein